MPPDFMRLFVAINPPPEILARLAVVQRRLKFPLARAGITWTKTEQIHVTLKFLGDVPAASLDELQPALGRACAGAASFELSAEGLGVFPHARKPRVIWAGLQGDLDALSRLQQRLRDETRRWREPEARGFRAHLTLGRVRRINPAQTRVLLAKLAELSAEESGRWRVGSVDLMSSTLAADGAVYTNLGRHALG